MPTPVTVFTVAEICDMSIAVYEQFKYWLHRAEQATGEADKKYAEMKYTEQKALLTKLAGMLIQKNDLYHRFPNLHNQN